METRSATFNPNLYSDVPLYNIQAVAAATGVPSITLRSWERRYGVPEPKRDAKGYRLYSERDIAIARWLHDRVQQGVGISRAVNMLALLQHGDETSHGRATFDFATLRSRLVDAVDRMDEAGVSRVLAEALMVGSVEDVALNLLQPVLYEIGDRWARGELTVTSEHVGSNLIRSHLAQLMRISPPAFRISRVMVGCAPGEQHDIGALILALFLRRRGFDVIYAGANVEPDNLLQDILRVQPQAVCLSASSPEAARAIMDVYSKLDGAFSGVRGFGGRFFNDHPAFGDQISGTWLGSDAGSAVERINTLVTAEATPR